MYQGSGVSIFLYPAHIQKFEEKKINGVISDLSIFKTFYL